MSTASPRDLNLDNEACRNVITPILAPLICGILFIPVPSLLADTLAQTLLNKMEPTEGPDNRCCPTTVDHVAVPYRGSFNGSSMFVQLERPLEF